MADHEPRDLDPRLPIEEAEGSKAWFYARATQLNVPGRGSMTKAELKDAIGEAERLPYGRHLSYEELRQEASAFEISGRSQMSYDELAPVVYEAAGYTHGQVTGSTDDEYWPVCHEDDVIGYCLKQQYPAIMTALYMNSERTLRILGGDTSGLQAFERESVDMAWDSFIKVKPANTRPVEALPR